MERVSHEMGPVLIILLDQLFGESLEPMDNMLSTSSFIKVIKVHVRIVAYTMIVIAWG